jgi:hypothetical protein
MKANNKFYSKNSDKCPNKLKRRKKDLLIWPFMNKNCKKKENETLKEKLTSEIC